MGVTSSSQTVNVADADAHYSVDIYTDMGHLIVESTTDTVLPKEITAFAYEKAASDLRRATDTDNLGCRFYVVRDGVDKTWTAQIGDISITGTYNVGLGFNPERMRWVGD
jgi:hypothetical protein